MVEDRDYMRYADREPRVSFTVVLLIINAIVFVVECVTCGYPPRFADGNYFALSLHGLEHGFIWQLVTYQFMHAGLLHILFNSWAIFMFGRQIEATLGSKKFLLLYFSGGIVGGLVEMLGALIWPGHFGTGVVGASAAGMALVAAFATFYPEEAITMFLYFVPITMRAKYFVWGIALLSALCIAFPVSVLTSILGGNVANGAHLGGMLTGFVFIRMFVQARWHLPEWKLPARRPPVPRELAVKRAGKKQFWTSGPIPPQEDLTADEYLQKEVDPILDKISARGIQSLTQREREILEKARSRINKR
jgi:membrane associated rhomboid family serine protease